MTIRVLHHLTQLDRGGAETWLLAVMDRLAEVGVHFDFTVEADGDPALRRDVEARGSHVHRVPGSSRTRRLHRALLAVHAAKNYDVVHTHGGLKHWSHLFAARRAGVPKRIAHSHNSSEPARNSRRRGVPVPVRRLVMRRCMTVGLACSEPAGGFLFGPRWRDHDHVRVLYCGIDVNRFARPFDGGAKRRELALRDDARTIVHIGNFTEQKNHAKIVDIARAAAARGAPLRILLVGFGPLSDNVRAEIEKYGLSRQLTILGKRDDVPEILRVSDGFLLPSLYEGLPLSLLEAQTAGLPSLVSAPVTEEADFRPDLVHRLPLDAPSFVWLDALLAAARPIPEEERRIAYVRARESPFSRDASAAALERIYSAP